MPTSDELIVHKAEEDLEIGIQHKAVLIRKSGHPIMAAAMQAGINGAIATLQLRSRFREDVRFLLSLAHRVNAGEDASKLADEHIERALRMRELSLIVRTKDPAFPEILARSRALLAKRLPDLARLAAVKDPADYDDLVRKAFPDRASVDAMIDENRDHVQWIIAHIKQHPHLLRVPAGWMGKLDHVATELIEWQTARVKKGVDEIYAHRAA